MQTGKYRSTKRSSIATLVLFASLPLLLDCTKKSTSPQAPAESPQSAGNLGGSKQSASGSTASGPSTVAGSPNLEQNSSATGVQPSSQAKGPAAPSENPNPSATNSVSSVETKPVAQPSCFVLKFAHKKTEGHDSEEDCLQHRNVYKLPQVAANQNSVCVRVNERPVAFKINKQRDEITLAPIVGPRSQVSIEYCTKSLNCIKNCKVPKDEFLAAMGVQESESDSTATFGEDAQGQNKKLHQEVKRELAEINAAQKDSGFGSDGISNFAGWQIKDENPMKCE